MNIILKINILNDVVNKIWYDYSINFDSINFLVLTSHCLKRKIKSSFYILISLF